MMEDEEDTAYIVLINAEEQYCLWPALADLPQGWTQVGPTGTRDVCSAFVEENWTDMTPKSRRA